MVDALRYVGITICLIILMAVVPVVPFAQGDEVSVFNYRSTMIYTNNGLSRIILPDAFVDVSLFTNTTEQTTVLTSINRDYVSEYDNEDNLALTFDSLSIAPGANVTIDYAVQMQKRAQSVPNINFVDAGAFPDIPHELTKYLVADGSWQVDDLELQSLAASIWAVTDNSSNVLEVVLALADWIGMNIKPQTHDYPLYPIETYDLRAGDCDDQANLLITLSRILKIPAYLRVGVIATSNNLEATYWEGHLTMTLQNIGYHGWAMIYIPPWGWLPFDMTLGWKQNTLDGITEAMTWKQNVLSLMNIQTRDWAGIGRWQRDFLVSNSLHLSNNDQLVNPNPELINGRMLWIGVTVFIIVSSYIIGKNTLATRRTHSAHVSLDYMSTTRFQERMRSTKEETS
jgi:transglutaminase-like putative cysteine protease